ncbi:hypothetical protein AVEN_249595-1 [Araneus ventricosus]|uniref:Uncharacterized protein n=1 Tax=Araneus ventricosus TaxID=182803 RepID=A0A4Y2RQD4_ARAVE|nr:hypothetical protein AVEN_249595-1 [Araneus ventricosus]
MYEEAERAFRKAKDLLPRPPFGEGYEARVAPSHLNVFLNLANLISRNGTRLEEADKVRNPKSLSREFIQNTHCKVAVGFKSSERLDDNILRCPRFGGVGNLRGHPQQRNSAENNGHKLEPNNTVFQGELAAL